MGREYNMTMTEELTARLVLKYLVNGEEMRKKVTEEAAKSVVDQINCFL